MPWMMHEQTIVRTGREAVYDFRDIGPLVQGQVIAVATQTDSVSAFTCRHVDSEKCSDLDEVQL